ncbi:hypothetical protein [Enterococcus mundtii]|uniref:hypothetical protein n=1 Tax=Enterococcus mundtii TaxID=53346 RepID=UPI0035C6EE1B
MKEIRPFTTVYTKSNFLLRMKQTLANQISLKHSDQLYQQLYDSGDDKADLEKALEVVKHFIPFYDCVVGIFRAKCRRSGA